MDTLSDLQMQRSCLCRLDPERALTSIDEAAGFLLDRGILTRTEDSALPSLYEACHEVSYRPGGAGFASWPATKWPWFGELADRQGVHLLKIHRGKNVLLTDHTLALVDPICRGELSRMERGDPQWGRLLTHLAEVGPSEVSDVLLELALKPRELKAIRYPLERCGALVSRQVVKDAVEEGHVHTAVLARWDQVYPELPPVAGGLTEWVVAAVRAAVVAPVREVPRWFSWPRLVNHDLIDRLIDEASLWSPAPGWVAAHQ